MKHFAFKPPCYYWAQAVELGDSLLTGTSTEIKPTKEVVGDAKLVGLYFGAGWCPPCRAFSVLLSELHDTAMSKGIELVIVFISADKSSAEFKEYYSTMPFAAIPYDRKDIRDKLASRYEVSEIPTVVVLDAMGSIIDSDARVTVEQLSYNLELPIEKWTNQVP
jgi:nucleoredoxin